MKPSQQLMTNKTNWKSTISTEAGVEIVILIISHNSVKSTNSACGNKGHWTRCCRKTKRIMGVKGQSKHRRSKSRNFRQHNQRRIEHRRRENEDINYTDVRSDKENYRKHFYSITVSAKCIDSITRQSRDEAYLTLNPPHLKYRTNHTLHIKIDSGVSGHTFSLRTFPQMYETSPNTLTTLWPTPHGKLTSCSDVQIPCSTSHASARIHKFNLLYCIGIGTSCCRSSNKGTIKTYNYKCGYSQKRPEKINSTHLHYQPA